MEFNKVIEMRRSIRKYLQKEVPKSVILKLIKAAMLAPSAHNSQPWRYLVITDKNIKINLASSMVEKWREDLIRDGMDNITVNSIINEGMKKIISSPVLIIAFLDMSEMMKYPDKRRRQAEYTMGIQSVAASIENLLLTATANGLGACWLCAPLFCKEIVKNALNVPSYFDPQALITLGYPDESPNIPKRKIINEIVKFNYWR